MAYENMTQEELEQFGYEEEMARLLGKDTNSALSNESEKVEETVKYADGTEVTIKNPNTPSSKVSSREQLITEIKENAMASKQKEDDQLADEAFKNYEKEGQVYDKSITEWEDMQRANGKLYKQEQTDSVNAEGAAAQAESIRAMEQAMAAQDQANNNPRGSAYDQSFNTGNSIFEEEMVVQQDGDSAFQDSAIPLNSSQAYSENQMNAMKQRAIDDYHEKQNSMVTYTNPNGSSAIATPGSMEAIALEGQGYIEGGKGQASLLKEGVTGTPVLEDRKEDKKNKYQNKLIENAQRDIDKKFPFVENDNENNRNRSRALMKAKESIYSDLNPSTKDQKDAFASITTDPIAKALFYEAVDSASKAEDVLDNEDAIKSQIGEGLTKDLMKLAFASLFGGSRGALSAYAKDEERKSKQADKMAEIEQKAINKQNADQTKAYANLNKEARAKAEKDKATLLSSVGSMLTKEQKLNHKAGYNGLAATLQGRGYNFGDYKLSEAFHKAVELGVKDSEKWGWDSGKAKGSIEGHFFERIGILTGDGMVSKDSNDLKESKAKQRSAFSKMQFQHKKPKEFSTKWLNKFREEKSNKGGEDGSWQWKNNFAGWTIEEIKKKQAEAEKAMKK